MILDDQLSPIDNWFQFAQKYDLSVALVSLILVTAKYLWIVPRERKKFLNAAGILSKM